MNKLKFVIFILFLTIGICTISLKLTNDIAESANNYLEKIEKYKDEKNFLAAEKICDELNEFWERKSKVLSMLIHHEMLEKMEENLQIIKTSCRHKSEIEISKASASFVTYLKALVESDQISLENVL
ncbi:MAG: DUF4363 family protein [Firmicutes bacterium]|nr:DUF4363 family protein [Bacillota bacterium]